MMPPIDGIIQMRIAVVLVLNKQENVYVREYVIHGANDSVLHLWTRYTGCK